MSQLIRQQSPHTPKYAHDRDRPYEGDPSTHLLCTKCGQMKLDSEFPVRRRSTHRRQRFAWCKDCKSEWIRQDRKKNPEKYRERARRGEARRTTEQRRLKYDRWYSQNREEVLARRRAWDKTPEGRAKSRERTREWRRKNREKHRESSRRYEQRRQVATVEKVDYKLIRVRDNDICHICGTPVTEETLSFDHVVPLARGGEHSMSNVKVAHRSCNFSKGARWW